MGEGGTKPKLERGANKKKQPQQQWARRRTGAAEKNFIAPTPGLEYLVFKQGDAADAAAFADVKKTLAKYARVNCKIGSSMAQTAISRLEEPVITKLANPPAMSNPPTVKEEVAREEWKYDLKDYVKKKGTWEDAKGRAFQVVMPCVDRDLEGKLESASTWGTISQIQDVVEMLKLIRVHAHQHDEIKQGMMALVKHDLALYLNYQKTTEDISTFHKLFKARCDVIDTFGRQTGYHPVIYLEHRKAMVASLPTTPGGSAVTINALTDAQNAKAIKSACEEYKTALFIHIANEGKYGAIKKKLDNMHLFEQGAYPKTLKKAKAYLENFQAEGGSGKFRHTGQQLDGMSFMQPDKKQLGPCHGCNKMGHLVGNCPALNDEEKKAVVQAMKNGGGKQAQLHVNVEREQERDVNKELQECIQGVANVNIDLDDVSIESVDSDGFFEGVAYIQPLTSGQQRLDCGRNKLFLDSCATQHTMFATEYLSRIHTTKVYLRQNCNAGSKLTNKCGFYSDLRFFVNEGGIANLLSVPALEKANWKIHMETGKPVKALSPTGMLLTFKRDIGVTGGMPYVDMDHPKQHVSQVISKDAITCIETVRNNMRGLTLEQFTKAKKARDAVAMMAHRPDEQMKHLASSKNVANIPFTSTDYTNGRVLFGPDRVAIRGKTTRRRPSRVRPELVTIPQALYEHLRDVILVADVMFVNGLPFFVTQSRDIKLRTVEFLPSHTAKQLHRCLQSVARLYGRGVFSIKLCLMDMEFKPLEDLSRDILVNTTAAREHVTDME